MKLRVFGCGALAVLFSSAQAALVINNPSRAAEIDPIDSGRDVSRIANNSTSETVLEGMAGFGAIGSFGFTGNQSLTEDYVFRFTSTALPDVRFKYTGNIVTAGATVSIANTQFATSGGTSMRLAGSTSGVYGMEIVLGDWDGSVFSDYSTQGVEALGFTLTGRYLQVTEITVDFFDGAGALLSSQSIADPEEPEVDSTTSAGYFGYQIEEGEGPIAKVVISVTPGTEAAGLFGLDDLGFTPVIPEPSSALLVAGGLLLGFRRNRC